MGFKEKVMLPFLSLNNYFGYWMDMDLSSSRCHYGFFFLLKESCLESVCDYT